MKTVRITMAQALVRFLTAQHVERDGHRQPFFAGCFGIFGHGNVAGIGQALHQHPELKFYLTRNEQAMVHTAAAYAKMKNRLQTLICTTSIGPGATNMVTAAAGATINRLPVLLLPGDVFARRTPAPVLQQLELPSSQDVSVNDTLRPVSKYWDRVNRPEQILHAAPEAMRVLTSPAETGAVTLALPQDVQAEAFDCPVAFLEERIWHVPRQRADVHVVRRAAALVKASKKPLIVAGGGVLYSEATDVLRRLAEHVGAPVLETQAGKGAMPYDHPLAPGAIGVTGTLGANRMAREADLVIGVGTRWSDFTTASKTAFENPDVRFVNVNVAEIDAFKHHGLAVVGDARAALEDLLVALADMDATELPSPEGHPEWRARAAQHQKDWDAEVERVYETRTGPPLSQAQVIGAVNALSEPRDVVVGAAGSLPGDLHKLWRTRDPKGYHLEYGYSCMGYEIAGGLGVKMAAPDREVYVMVGDGSYLMMAQEIATAVQEGVKLTIVLLDNQGFASIGSLSESLGSGGFGTRYRHRDPKTGRLDGPPLRVDLAANARSLGATVHEATDHGSLDAALRAARDATGTTVVVVPVDREARVGGYESWWDVPVAEVSEQESVRAARDGYEEARRRERVFL